VAAHYVLHGFIPPLAKSPTAIDRRRQLDIASTATCIQPPSTPFLVGHLSHNCRKRAATARGEKHDDTLVRL
jgi:hypothetical protein